MEEEEPEFFFHEPFILEEGAAPIAIPPEVEPEALFPPEVEPETRIKRPSDLYRRKITKRLPRLEIVEPKD